MSGNPNLNGVKLESNDRLKSRLSLYQSLDVQKAAIPPRSRLYHLEPIGVGTPYVESLTGYVARLAQQHCVTVKQLILTEIAPLQRLGENKPDYRIESISDLVGIDRRRAALNGTGLMATNLVRTLEALTRQSNLHFLTLLSWAQVLPKRGLLRSQRAWCPTCYQQWRCTDQSIYEPLIWSINAVEFCPYHHHRLLNRCSHCHQPQPVISGNFLPGYCIQCGKWLGSTRLQKATINPRESEYQKNWGAFVVNNLGELIAATPSLKQPPHRTRIFEMISTYINQISGGDVAALARFAGMQKATLASWCKGKAIPQLDKLLQLIYHLEISLLDFLTIDMVTTDSLPMGTRNLLPKPKQSRKPYKRLNVERKQVLNLVLQEVIQEYPPPSLEDVALRLRCRPLVLQHHFPDLSEQIKVSHAAYRKVCQQQKIQPVLEAALQESPPPSLMEITRRLGYKNSSYLYKYFSELSRSISRRYKDYVKTCGVETRNRIREEIQTIALKLHSEGQKPTQRRVTELLTKPGIMLNQYAQETLRQVQRSLGYDS